MGKNIMQNSKDDRVIQQVKNKLTSRGFGSGSHLTVQSSKGMITLSGSVQYAHQKKAAVSAITGMAGVNRVIDQMTVKPAINR